jgi:hypothetical protein
MISLAVWSGAILFARAILFAPTAFQIERAGSREGWGVGGGRVACKKSGSPMWRCSYSTQQDFNSELQIMQERCYQCTGKVISICTNMSQATCRAQYINKNNLTFFTSPVFIDQEVRMCSVHIYYLHARSYVPAVDVSCRDFISHGKVQALNLYPCIFVS